MLPVLLFSGQGAQKVGMGKDLAETFPTARDLFQQADATLGFSLTSVMFEGPLEDLTRTSRCQPALYTHGLALLAVLREQLPELRFGATAGLSLGEFTAHAAAGTFDFTTGLRLVHERGSFMEEACAQSAGSMLAMLGGEEATIRALAQDCDIDVANLNAPGQIVLSGSTYGIEAAAAQAKERGIKRAIPLQVAGAYHSRLMQPAQDKLAAELAAAPLSDPLVPVISNFAARPVAGADDIRATLTSQVTGSVRWVESMSHLLSQGHTLFIELGPDSTLSGLLGKIDKNARAISIKDTVSLESALPELRALA